LSAAAAVRWAKRSRPLAGELESGDVHVVSWFPGGVLLAVIDGLGHGHEAAVAARLAATILESDPERPPAEQIAQCHAELKRTRGAAMLVVSLSIVSGTITWSGVGNVDGWLLRAGKRDAMISRPGVVGYQITPPRDRSDVLRAGDLLVLASDGIAHGFCEALRTDGDVDELAETILTNHARAADDALVLVARYQPEVVA